MSRRHTSSHPRLRRALVAAMVAALTVAAALPAGTSAQSDQSVEQLWQVLTYLDRGKDSTPVPVPAGVNATLLMHSGSVAVGEAACSSYETTYARQRSNLTIFPATPEFVPCDSRSEQFDRTFYELLGETASFDVGDSILTLKNAVGEALMVLTRAKIAQDPTVARWDILRLGSADGSVESVIDGLEPWVEFLRGGRIVGDTGCGWFLGWYDTNEGTMQVSDVHDRLGRACTEGARRQAEAVVNTLGEITTFQVLPAGLALKDLNGVTRLGLEPEIELGGRTWTPTAILDSGGSPLRTEKELTTSAVAFKDRRAEGVTICRPFRADALRAGLAVSLDGDTIDHLGNKACRTQQVDLPGIEKDFEDALLGAASHALRGDELELRDVDGNVLMRLEPQADLLDITWHVTRLETPVKGKKLLRPPIGDCPLTVNFSEFGTVEGRTGACDPDSGDADNFGPVLFDLPQAAIVAIQPIESNDISGGLCSSKAARNTAECKQEQLFVSLLSSVDGYIVLDNELRLRRGLRTIMTLEPEFLVGAS